MNSGCKRAMRPDKGILVKMLADKAGYDVTTPHGADRLQKDIELASGERLSVNTIKRLTGVIGYEGGLRESTLDIVALYLGYNSARELNIFLSGASSDFRLPSNCMDLASLPADTLMEIEWLPDRKIRLRHLSGGRYLVEESLNSKIKDGDFLSLRIAGEGLPLLASDVERDGKSLGPYTAAPESGVTTVKIL